MKQVTYRRRWALLFLALALFPAACSGGGDSAAPEGGAGGEGGDGAAEGGTFSTFIVEPEALFPQNTNETAGAEVLNALFDPLVEYDLESAQPIYGEEAPRAVAQSVESDDQQTWTITLKDGWTFHNGEPVTAQSYVNAWNYGAYGPNAQNNNYFFANIQGYTDLQCETDEEGNCVADPVATEMSGLTAVDEQTIEVVLSAPFSQFPLTIGYTAFYPVPEVALEDPEAYNEAPIGNGPFMMDGVWNHNQNINVVRYEDYAGDPARASGIEFRIYAEPDTAYNDLLGGALDILEDVPIAQVEQARQEFGDAFLEGQSSNFNYLGFPIYDPRFANPDIRMAMSMAIDRQAITDAIVLDAEPADAFVSPVVAGYQEGACGQACEYNPEAARQMFDAAGGLQGPVTIWFNAGGDHEAWTEAVANQWRENLGITDVTFEILDFAEYLPLLSSNGVTGPFRLGWVMDYPSPQNYLEPLHVTGGSSNYTGYSNPQFDELIAQGNAAGSIEDGLQFYSQAQDILAEDVPIMPMFFGSISGAHSERVSNVELDPFTRLNLAEIEVTE